MEVSFKTVENFVAENTDNVDVILIIHINIVSLQKFLIL